MPLPSAAPVPLLARLIAHPADAVAVVCGRDSLTYGELERRSRRLAHRLAPQAPVVLCATRSVDTIMGLLAILRAGAVYVPLDPEYPADLQEFVARDCGAETLLVPRAHPEILPSSFAYRIQIDDESEAPATELPPFSADRLAYIIYTSGSTGRPKGVLVTHANLAHSTDARLHYYPQPPSRFLLLSSFAFDSSIAGIFWTLTSGGTLVLPAAGEERDPSALAALIARQRITHTLCLPALHALLLESSADLSSLKTVIVAGENCPPDLPARHAVCLPKARLYNEYGPTEATVWSTAAELTATTPVTIGQAIPGTAIHLLDTHGAPVADGAPGEIHIGGPGVARGYLNQPALTAAAFITSAAGDHLYKTGDLARRRADGNLEFLGRADRQIKLRGHRIELEAIETVLQSHPEVRAAAVLVHAERLVAYLNCAPPTLPAIRQFLGEKLPAYMQPGAFVTLEEFPRSPNGKIDRAALPPPDRSRPTLDSEFAAPRTALERFLAEEWSESLALDRVGIHDKFFDLGGDSLRAAALTLRLQKKLGEPVFVVAIFTAPTIAQLAEFLKKNYATAVGRLFGETATPSAGSTSTAVERVRSLLPATRNLSSATRLPERAIFILAPPRSGTTLLRAMLASHPRFFTSSELRLLGFDTLAERRAAYSGAQSMWHRGIVRSLAEARHIEEAEAARFVEDCEQQKLPTAEFFSLLQHSITPRELVDKSPSYALDPAALRQAEEIFENAFYIHLARHPYEAITTFAERRMDQAYLPGSDLSPRAAGEAVWQISHQNILDFLATVPSDRQIDLRFTDLVSQPRAEMEKLCAALAIPFDPALLNPYKTAPATDPTGAHSFDDPNFRTRNTIDSTKAEGWRGVIHDNFLSAETWSLAEKLGYEKPPAPVREPDDAVAIVGLAGRFPGANDVESFWRNLCDGVESIRPFTPDELRASGIDPAVLSQPDYVNAGAVPDDADHFAASFFGYTPREAELMDPQQRLFLECAWEAFEHAGCDVSRFPGAIGVFAGLALNSYFQNNLATRAELTPLLGHYSLTIGNEKDFVATRVAHKLGLRGPAIGVQTACSSSLVAVHLACQSLRLAEIDLALVGGGRVRAPLHAGYTYIDGGIPSPDGHCRAFDAEARGCVAASGMAAVVLKRLRDARRDGDHIFAVIKATAINNDGGDKAGFTAPSVEGQAEVITRAHAAAGITADTLGYVEAHGTGTSLGDPIEVAALTRAFRSTSTATAHCRLGSVKSNIGHLDAGAGVAGLIKAALTLDRGAIPPTLHFKNPNPQIDFANSPFIVNAALRDWPRGNAPRRAGVSSFGIGGTNAHVVLEEAPPSSSSSSSSSQLLILSAKTITALDRASANLAAHLRAHPDLSLADIAFTLQTGRRQFQHRRIVVAHSASDAAGALETSDPRRVITAETPAANAGIVFMFPGQGAQYPGMARELFETEPVFRAALQRCADILRPHLDLLAALYPTAPTNETMTATAIAQPAIFSVEYALAKLWESRGITPTAMLGHSVGEFTAACLAGVFTLEDALTLLAGRARLMQSVAGGSMLAVRLPEADLRARLNSSIEIAAINSPRLCVVSGPPETIADFAAKLSADGVACAPLQTSHAFHSKMMEPVVEPFTALARKTRFAAPRVSIISTLTGDHNADLTAPEYWARQLREPVRFASAVAAVEENCILLEVGPGNTLTPLARQTRGGTAISSLHKTGEHDQSAMLEALGRLWLAGVSIDWNRLHANEPRLRVPLPTYPFERERYWLEPGTRAAGIAPIASPTPATSEVADLRPQATPQRQDEIKAMLHELSGVPVERMRGSATFLELGFDSLFLTQAALALRKRFGVMIAFRQLFEELSTIDALAAFLQGSEPSTPAVPIALSAPSAPVTAAPESFGPFRPLNTSDATALTATQREHLAELTARYTARTAASKKLTQQNRAHFADPRSISGFRPFWKELTYPIAVESSSGARMRDVDGNEYIDFTMGFGTNLLGHSPKFINEAIAAQLDRGLEIGPQSPFAGEVARLLCEFSGQDRAAFCNTGSEAVVGAIRAARTVSGRDRIATCSGYHGINDEFLVRAKTIGGERRTVAIAPGIPDHVARGVLALDYGAPESLAILRAHIHELAALIVEPVQSRHPDLQPREFLLELRRITEEAGVALIFDEVITGFRCHLRGAQEWFGVRADLVTYGKIIGGGMPIGALCGRAKYMDALDGGTWNFGDDSRPETGVTFFAGTYVRHPLAIAAAHAALNFLKESGPTLQEALNERTAALVTELNSFLTEKAVPLRIESFASMMLIKFNADFAYGGLLFFHLREKGIHAWDNRLLFLSTAHTEKDIASFVRAFRESVEEMEAGGFFSGERTPAVAVVAAPIAKPEPKPEPVRIPPRQPLPARELQFSLYFFGNYPAPYRADKYNLVIESSRFADTHNFTAVWLPERHFHSVGGFSPNAAVMAAALARETTQLQLRAGSVVLPLHHPVRVAEEWSLVDNLSGGRVGISIASGWHPNDFVFAPDAYEKRRELCTESLATIRKLWRGESVNVRSGAGAHVDITIFPRPVQPELPVWMTCVQPESWRWAGELGANVLAQLQNQSLDDVAEKIRIYREARARAGHDRGHVTMLVHTFVTDDADAARAQSRGPLREYLRSHVEISQRKLASKNGAAAVAAEDLDFLLGRAVEDYANGKAFIGTPESCAEVAANLNRIGIDEVGCLIDFGIEPRAVLASLPHLDRLRETCTTPTAATLPLTDSQRGLCLLASTDDDASRAYNEVTPLEILGPLDHAAVRAAVQALVDRHEAFRTTIDPASGRLTIHPSVTIEVPLTEDLEASLADIRALRFDLTRAPLLDARLCRLGPEHHILILVAHHIFANGPSLNALCDDLSDLLASTVPVDPLHPNVPEGQQKLAGGEASPRAQTTGPRHPTNPTPAGVADAPHLPALPPTLQLRDFIRWHAERSEENAAAFWQAQFADNVPTLDLPLDHPRPPRTTYRGGREWMRVDAEFASAVRGAGAKHGGSLFMTLLTAFQVLLHRLSGQDDLVVSVPFEDPIRSEPGGERLFANTTNVCPLRSRLDTARTFTDLLAANRRLVLEANEHQHYFFGKLIEALKLPYDPSRPAFFSVLFNYESGSYRRDLGGGRTLELINDREPFLNLRDTAMAELYLNVAEVDGALLFRCEYNRDLFDGATVERWLGHLRTLLESIVADIERPATGLPLLAPAEREQVLTEWNRTERDFPRERTVAALFEDCVVRTPEAIALVDGKERISYARLDARANAIAADLHRRGITVGSLVGLPAERSAQFIAGILGVLKAGGAYVPLDADEPAERLAAMRSQCACVLDFASLPQPDGATSPHSKATALDPAYVLFTSGSTGTPKGVVVPHQAIARLVINNDYAPFLASDVVAFASNVCFDAATFEIWGALLNGGKLVVTPREMLLSPATLEAHLNEQRVSVLFLTTSLFNRLAHEAPTMFRGLRHLVFGGEAADAASVKLVLESGGKPQRLVNGYGPTEVTTFSVCHQIEQVNGASVPIGRPIANTTAYILDRAQEPVPIGVTSELYLGGPGVALGYHAAPELTARHFLETEYSRLYRTGDLARWRSDGTIEYCGRADEQIKLRGFRIEPGEIETALQRHPAIRQAAVALRETTAGPALVAFLVRGGGAPSDSALREFLAPHLPPRMIPAHFVWLDALPLTANGKLDQRALPDINEQPAEEASAGIAPRTPLEKEVAELWESLLGRNSFSVDDSFFASGGHSLLAIQLMGRLREKFGVDVPARRLFETPTIGGLAQFISEQTPTAADPSTRLLHSLVCIQKGAPNRRPFFLVAGGWGGEIEFLVYAQLTRELGADLPLYGLKAHGADSETQPHQSVTKMAADYITEMRTRQPHGPYLLGGECVGGVVAYEMARQLTVVGEKVELLVLLDTERPTQHSVRRFTRNASRQKRERFWEVRVVQPTLEHLQSLKHLPLQGQIDYVWQRTVRRARHRRRQAASTDRAAAILGERKLVEDYPKVILRHQLAPYAGNVTLLVDETSFAESGHLGWDEVSTGGLDVHVLPGDHLSYIREHAGASAAKLSELIDRAEHVLSPV